MTTNQALVQGLQRSSGQLEQTVSGFDADQGIHVPAAGVVGPATLIGRQVPGERDLPSLPATPKDWSALFQMRPENGTAQNDDSGRGILERFLRRRRALIAAVPRIAPEALDRHFDPPGRDRNNPVRRADDDLLFVDGKLQPMII